LLIYEVVGLVNEFRRRGLLVFPLLALLLADLHLCSNQVLLILFIIFIAVAYR
jgi:hypothetical protein